MALTRALGIAAAYLSVMETCSPDLLKGGNMAELGDRTKYLGFSDIARCITRGESHQVVAEKLGIPGVEETDAMALGTALEPALVQWAVNELHADDNGTEYNAEVRPPQTADVPIRGHVDAILWFDKAPSLPLEAKTHGLIGPDRDDWGEPGTDEIPEYPRIQIQLAMHALGTDKGYVVVWRRSGRALYHVAYDRQYAEKLVEYGCRLWGEYVVPGKLPPLDENDWPRWATLARPLAARSRTPSKIIALPKKQALVLRRAIESWEAVKKSQYVLGKLVDAGKAKLLATLVDAEAIDLGDGRLLTTKTVQRRGYTVKPSEYPQLTIINQENNQDGQPRLTSDYDA